MASPDSNQPRSLDLEPTLSSLPPPWLGNLRAEISTLLRDPATKTPVLVALDDDPTGTQTCHDVPVLTVWDVPTLTAELARTPAGSGFFILTNSRALHPGPAQDLSLIHI